MDFQIEHYQDISSTNSHLKEIVKKGNANEGTVILADYQGAGRGRSSNIWIAERGKNLLLSILFYPKINPEQHFFITEFVSLAIIDFLQTQGITASVKWPNDIYVENNKIAGILIENSILGSVIDYSIAGIGLNINQINFPEDLPNPTSMAAFLGKELKLELCLQELLDCIKYRYNQLKDGGFEILHTQYNEALFMRNKTLQYRTGEGITMKGTLLKVEQNGELIIETSGRVQSYLFGDIQWILND